MTLAAPENTPEDTRLIGTCWISDGGLFYLFLQFDAKAGVITFGTKGQIITLTRQPTDYAEYDAEWYEVE